MTDHHRRRTRSPPSPSSNARCNPGPPSIVVKSVKFLSPVPSPQENLGE